MFGLQILSSSLVVRVECIQAQKRFCLDTKIHILTNLFLFKNTKNDCKSHAHSPSK